VNPDFPPDTEPHALDIASNESLSNSGSEKIGPLVRRRIISRLWRLADSATAFVSIILIYGGFLFSEKAIIWLIIRAYSDEIARNIIVALWFDRLQIGLALMTALGGFLHGLWALYKQLKSDYELSK
jgi:hypothetical protein